jgi:3-oxoacyl-[acyl-carrier protein] reductase
MNSAKTRELEGKVALITGAARNIGRTTALMLAEAGARVALNIKSAREEAETVAAEIAGMGSEAMVIQADVAVPDQVVRMTDAVAERFGRLDILVNNAAVRHEADFLSIDYGKWRDIVAVILDGAFLCARSAIPHMLKQGHGRIVNIGGLTAHTGAPRRAHVIAAKAGLVGLTKALAHDFAKQGISVNCVVPGRIDTTRGGASSVAVPAHHSAHDPLPGRLGRPDEVAGMIRYLCGPHSRYITGQTIHVNGGLYLP